MKTNKTDINFYLDVVLLVLFMGIFLTGLLMYLLLPPGSGQATFIGLTRHGWGDVHFWLGLVFFVLISIHLWLHWKWILAKLNNKKRPV